MAVVEAYGLTKKFGDFLAVDNITLKLQEGEVLGFLGPNGAGKTTTIRMLAGIIGATSGYAMVAGKTTNGQIDQIHEVIGLLTETPGFYERLTAHRNLEFFGGFYSGIDVPIQIEKYLKLMGLWERRNEKVGNYSKGMKQRLALVRACLHEPVVLFLDEPTSGLDPEAAEEVRGLIKRMSREGRTIFLSTHNLTEAEELCHRIAVVRTRLLALDTPEALRKNIFRREVVIKLESVPEQVLEMLKNLEFIRSMRQDGNRLILELENADTQIPRLIENIIQAGGKVLGVSEERHSLEEIYLNLVREEKKA